jgi:hypothetical membrane protein
MANIRVRSFVRDAAIATAVIAGLYGLAYVEFPPFQITGYLIVMGFGMLEGALGPVQSNFDLVFGLYLVGLGLVGASVVTGLRRVTGERGRPAWQSGVAGALAVVGVLSLLFALFVLFGSTQLDPVLITGAVGLVLLALAAWLVGVFDESTASTSK